MYLIAETIGEIISLIGLIAQIKSAIGIAITIDVIVANDIRANEYRSPGNNWSDRIRFISASHVASGDGMNSGVVSIEPNCHKVINITTPSTFFMFITSINFVLFCFGCLYYSIYFLFVKRLLKFIFWRRVSDSNARWAHHPSPIFKIGSLNHSDNSPY